MTSSVNIAILGRGFVNWGGGIDLLRILVNGLTAIQRDGNPIHVLLPRDSWKSRLVRQLLVLHAKFVGALAKGRHPPAQSPRPTEEQLRNAFATYGNRVEVRFFDDTERGLLESLRAVRADIVLPCMYSLGAKYPVPWIGYILDFQHVHLPHLFSRWNRVYRRYTFTALMREARAILVNARAVEIDALQFYPHSQARITPLPFAPSIRKEWLAVDIDGTRSRFGIPERYFIICNQFWVHKDHQTAFRAFAAVLQALPAAERSIALVCTGSMHDYRAPQHMGQLRALLDQLAVTGSVHLLGHIAKEEQIALLRGAVAVIQPTLFEGGPGGGALYDAVALGVRSIVSDIPVNREIDDERVRYFPPQRPDELARLMLEALGQPKAALEDSQLLARSATRVRKLGETLQQAILAALQ
jgi:glycosyltransferase involved in cell wall biosynthesis